MIKYKAYKMLRFLGASGFFQTKAPASRSVLPWAEQNPYPGHEDDDSISSEEDDAWAWVEQERPDNRQMTRVWQRR